MAATAQIVVETLKAPIAVSRPALTLVPAIPPKPRLRCRWEYNEREGRIVQIWELRP